MPLSRPPIALLFLGGGNPGPVVQAIEDCGGQATLLSGGADLSDAARGRAAGLCVAGEGPFGLSGESAPGALRQALDAKIPVLAIEAGMHALNLALGGGAPVPVAGHVGDGGSPLRHSVFMSLGGRLADTIGGAGFVSPSGGHTHAVTRAVQAPGTLAGACAVDDGAIEAIELHGAPWVIGVQWRAHMLTEQPSGFDNLFHALAGMAAAA